MAEPFGVPAGRVSSDVPGVIPGGPRPLQSIPEESKSGPDGTEAKAESGPATDEAPTVAAPPDESVIAGNGREGGEPAAAMPIGDEEEILELSDEEKAAIPTRSDDA
jgi:hypothetical protein